MVKLLLIVLAIQWFLFPVVPLKGVPEKGVFQRRESVYVQQRNSTKTFITNALTRTCTQLKHALKLQVTKIIGRASTKNKNFMK